MFDTPDLGPVCYAPFVALIFGAIFYACGWGIVSLLQRRTAKSWAGLGRTITLSLWIVIPLACIASAALQIGALDPEPWFPPTSYDVVGKWQLNSGTVDALARWSKIPVKDHLLEFRQDGTFIMQNVPNFCRDPRSIINSNEQYITGSGTWEITQREGVRFMLMRMKPANDLLHLPKEFPMYFGQHLPPYQLQFLYIEGCEQSLIFRFNKKWW